MEAEVEVAPVEREVEDVAAVVEGVAAVVEVEGEAAGDADGDCDVVEELPPFELFRALRESVTQTRSVQP